MLLLLIVSVQYITVQDGARVHIRLGRDLRTGDLTRMADIGRGTQRIVGAKLEELIATGLTRIQHPQEKLLLTDDTDSVLFAII